MLFGGYPYNSETWTFTYQSSHADESCTNAADDDGDGLVDCDDPDCSLHLLCQPGEDCGNTADDNGDGLADCAVPNCGGTTCGPNGHVCGAAACICLGGSTEFACDDGQDNDCDSLVDCADADCAGVSGCP